MSEEHWVIVEQGRGLMEPFFTFFDLWPGGHVRLSMPAAEWQRGELDHLRIALLAAA